MSRKRNILVGLLASSPILMAFSSPLQATGRWHRLADLAADNRGGGNRGTVDLVVDAQPS